MKKNDQSIREKNMDKFSIFKRIFVLKKMFVINDMVGIMVVNLNDNF